MSAGGGTFAAPLPAPQHRSAPRVRARRGHRPAGESRPRARAARGSARGRARRGGSCALRGRPRVPRSGVQLGTAPTMRSRRARSRRGCVRTNPWHSPIASSCRPSSRSAVRRSSWATSLSSSNRSLSGRANGSPRMSARASPRQSIEAGVSRPQTCLRIRCASHLGEELLESADVDRLIGHVQHERATATLQDAAVSEAPAQPRRVDIQGVCCRFGRIVAPERVDQDIARDGLIPAQKQIRQQGALLSAAELRLGTLNFERAKEAECQHGCADATSRSAGGIGALSSR